MKKVTIKIKILSNSKGEEKIIKEKTIKAYKYNDYICLHRDIASPRYFVATHTPSGRHIGIYSKLRKNLVALLDNKIMPLGINWVSFKDVLNSKNINELKRIVEQRVI